MSASIVRDTIAAEIALLTPITAPPAPPFGYGSDLRCDSDLTLTMDEVGGLTTLALAEALVRRLDCPRGGLPDDADYGLDLRGYCNRGTTDADIRSLASRIRSELTKDDRVDALAVVVAPSNEGSSLAVTIRVTPFDPRIGGFALTLAVTSSSVLIEELRA